MLVEFSNVNGNEEGDEYRHHKIDILMFDGTYPDGWILQAECYFAIYQLVNKDKMEAIDFKSHGRCACMVLWMNKQQSQITWG